MIASGEFDFSGANPLDRRWQLKLTRAIDAMEEKIFLDVVQLIYSRHCAVLSNPDGVSDACWKETQKSLRQYVAIAAPWLELESEEEARAKLAQGWNKAFGDPNDPAVAAAIDETARMLIKEANEQIAKHK